MSTITTDIDNYYGDPIIQIEWQTKVSGSVIEFFNPKISAYGVPLGKGGIKEAANILLNALKAEEN